MKVWVKGEGEVTLGQADFIASGGEGTVYGKGNTAYKVYADPTRAVPADKLRELSGIRPANIIKPEKMLVDKAGKPLGYTMRFVQDAMPLCQLFPRVFRERNGIDAVRIGALVEQLRNGVQAVHDAGVLIVDLNEMNFLVRKDFRDLYFIDVDSYQTPHYPATALMLSVRDWQVQNNDWTQFSDWYSFAIVAFTLFTGIHPYKGKHPSLKGFEERMKASVSVFNADVQVPKAAYPIDVIPSAYRDWMYAVLEGGERSAPPGTVGRVTFTPHVKVLTGTNVTISELREMVEAIIGHVEHDGREVIWTKDAVWVDNQCMFGAVGGVRGVGFTPRSNLPVLAGVSMTTGRLKLLDLAHKTSIPLDMRADDAMAYGGTVYIRAKNKILRLVLTDLGPKIVASVQLASSCLEHATQMFEGVVLQSLLGRAYATVFPEAGKSYQCSFPDLDSYRIVDAKFDGHVLVVVGFQSKTGTYDRFVFRLSSDFTSYDVRKVEDIQPAGLNFVTLPSGICVAIDEEERLEVFSSRKGSVGMKKVDDPAVRSDMRLGKKGGQVVFPQNNKLFGMSLR